MEAPDVEASRDGAPRDKANILIVDDRDDGRIALQSALADLNQNLVAVASGREALKQVLRMDFAVILLDVHMPGMDGFETAALIRQRMGSCHTPIIFITAHADEVHLAEGYSLGAVDYILAPVVPEVLRAKVSVLVDLFRKRRALPAQADAHAREANRLEDAFLATLSHELRTPLTAMLGWIRLLRSEPPDTATLEHGLAVIERNVEAQSRLIEDLLDVSRITRGKLRLELKPICLRSVLEAAIDAIRPAAERKNIALHVNMGTTAMNVNGDADRLRQVAWNLLANAVKFAPDDGEVWIDLQRDAGDALIRVRDSGQGIDSDLLPQVFDRFRQGDSSSTRSHRGLGVGLAIVRHIVELHDGTVDTESAGSGQGAIFLVRLPVCRSQPSAQAPAPATQPGAESLHGLRVLVVDDESDARELLGRILRHHGAHVEIAASTDEALGVLERYDPHVLLSDIAMPGRDGYELIETLRRRTDLPGSDRPAIALTAHAEPGHRQRTLQSGFQLHVAKPVAPHHLVQAIGQVARRGGIPGR